MGFEGSMFNSSLLSHSLSIWSVYTYVHLLFACVSMCIIMCVYMYIQYVCLYAVLYIGVWPNGER